METSGPRSLAFLAQKACTKYLKRINDIGDCPYDLIRPVLLKLENPEQLHQLEINSPQIIGHDGEIWLQLIKRDIPDWETKPHQPRDPKNWWKVYKKLKEQTQKDREQGAVKLKAALDSIKDEREQNLAKVVSRKDLPKEPTNHKARILYNYNSGKTGSKSGHKLTLLEKIRKEARDARLARLHLPTSQLTKRPGEVKEAPKGLVEDYKRAALQRASASVASRPVIAPRMPRPPLAVTKREKPAVDKSFLGREERLRALTEGRPKNIPSMAQSRSTSLDSQSSQPATSASLSKSDPCLQQSDGAVDEDVEDTGLLATRDASNSQATSDVHKPPKHRLGTLPLSRLGSPGPPTKRKAEPSIFMNAKKSKVGR